MMKSVRSGRVRVWVVAIGVITANQMLVACAQLAAGRSLGGVVGVGPTRNAGSVLGFAQRNPAWIVVALAGIGLCVALERVIARSSTAFGLGLLLGGAVANTAQRFTAGGVADYVHFGVARMEFAFNLADLALLAGAVLTTRAIAQLPALPIIERVERG
jgi:lipoprotein signal peptidase